MRRWWQNPDPSQKGFRVNAPSGRPQIYRFDIFEVDTQAHELRRQGVRIRLRDQPYQVLLLLLERAGRVVTRDELRHRVWPSSVVVDFDHGLNNAIAQLREALGDSPAAPRFIETIPRVGYRFLVAVAAVQEEPAIAPAPSPPIGRQSPATTRWIRKRWLIVAGAAAAALLMVALLRVELTDRQGEAQLAQGVDASVPSIAVLPFVNLSSENGDEQVADGLTEELVTKLAGIRGLRVVARTSSFRFKGKQESAATIAQALQVDHFVEGSVRRSGDRLRITAQLIDASKDEHIWSQTFERNVGDIFEIQEDIAFAVADALKVSLLEADKSRVRKRGTSDPEAHRLYLIARAHLLGGTRAPDLNVAKRSLDAALQRDPEFAAAHAWLARYYLRMWARLPDPDEAVRMGVAAAERAVALDPDSSEALQALANFKFWRYRYRGDYEAHVAGQSEMQRAIELDPSNSLAFQDLGDAILWHDPDAALAFLDRAIQLDVLCTDPNIAIAIIQGSRGQLEAARRRCEDLLKRVPDATGCTMAIATLEHYFGNFPRAIELLLEVEKSIGPAARNQLWAIHMSMGDRAGAERWLDFGGAPYQKALTEAARYAMDGRYDQAFRVLQRHREETPQSLLLDLPAARFALLAGKPKQALEILEQRLPDLAAGIEPISARVVMPALDLATAQIQTGAREEARALLERIAAYLDGPHGIKLPMFAFQRARAHALAGENDAALRALDLAYEAGFRTTWALDLRPQHLLYNDPIDADPAFAALGDDPRLVHWFERIRADTARQLAQTRARQQASVGGVRIKF
jgi:TolB-like protein/DNA-binding winged helix-turn-helix (wHTH) protein/Tfp pilus assembly protein PilF